jgi:hypothetical protein
MVSKGWCSSNIADLVTDADVEGFVAFWALPCCSGISKVTVVPTARPKSGLVFNTC